MKRRAALALNLAVALCCLCAIAPRLSAQSDQNERPRAGAALRFDLATDAAERRIYRPEFSFAWPVGGGEGGSGGGRVFFDLSYLQRMNGALRGSIDYWIRAGGGLDLAPGLSLEASLTHFCRHLTSIDNGYVLNLNELAGLVRWRGSGIEAALGYGRYVGGSPGYGGLAIFTLAASRVILPELSFESRWKWVDFGTLLHDVTLAVDLGRGIEIFLRSARTYGLDTETFLGVRLSGGAPDARGARRAKRGGDELKRAAGGTGARAPLSSLRLSTGAYPFFNSHKLLVNGAFRLELAKSEGGARSSGGPDSGGARNAWGPGSREPRESGGRFLADLEFDAPVLTGDGFFAQFWPDRMIYRFRAEYEKAIGDGLFAAWYARYDVDMPVDRAVAFLASLSTGAAIRNQPDFERLDKPLRFEAWAGLDFKYDYDVGLKVGINTTARGRQAPESREATGALNAGAELRWQANGMREAAELKIFGEFAGAVVVRPFIGVKKISYAAGGTPGPGTFAERITVGVALYKWF